MSIPVPREASIRTALSDFVAIMAEATAVSNVNQSTCSPTHKKSLHSLVGVSFTGKNSSFLSMDGEGVVGWGAARDIVTTPSCPALQDNTTARSRDRSKSRLTGVNLLLLRVLSDGSDCRLRLCPWDWRTSIGCSGIMLVPASQQAETEYTRARP